MNTKDRISSIKKSSSSNSSRAESTSIRSILTSTRNQEETPKSSHIDDRRKSIIPTPNRPKERIKTFSMDRNEDKFIPKEKNIEETETIDDTSIKGPSDEADNTLNKLFQQFSNTSIHMADKHATKPTISIDNFDNKPSKSNDVELKDNSKTEMNIKDTLMPINSINPHNEKEFDTHSQSDQNNIDDNFDEFILENFTQFSGQQNVTLWLDETERKFKQYRIGRSLRFEAISLLIEGEAKRTYIKYRKNILSFDDFYEFLFTHFDSSNLSQNHHKSGLTVPQNTFHPTSANPLTSTLNNTQQQSYASTLPNLPNVSSILPSGTITDCSTTNLIGTTTATQSTVVPNNTNSTSLPDETVSDLRKAIVGNLIKNPKTFKGGKDDVNKWIEEIEHLFDVAHIPESTRLDLISYSLRGDALEWFKANRSSLTLWTVFVLELKKAFTSSFHGEVAFKKLEAYTQGENQSIRNFFTEVLKLCKEADPTMSEATKLKNLLNKTKPSIQLEVRKKKPTTTSEFLEYAKEAEELFQLSSSTSDETSNANAKPTQYQQIPSLVPNLSTSTHQSFGYPKANFSSTYYPNPNRGYYSNNSHRNNNSYSSMNTYSQPQSFRNKPQMNNKTSYTNRYQPSSDYNNNSRSQQATFRNNSSRQNYSNQRTANTINPTYLSTTDDSQYDQFSPILCTQCNELGHEASACPHF